MAHPVLGSLPMGRGEHRWRRTLESRDQFDACVAFAITSNSGSAGMSLEPHAMQ